MLCTWDSNIKISPLNYIIKSPKAEHLEQPEFFGSYGLAYHDLTAMPEKQKVK